MKSHRDNAVWSGFSPMWFIGLTLVAGSTIDFATELIWHDQQRIEQIVLLLILALAVATIWRKSLLTSLISLPSPSRWALGLGFALGSLSAALSIYPRFAGLEWATLLLLMGLAFVLAGQARNGGHHFDTWAMRLVVALAVLIALKIMTGYVAAIMGGFRLDTLALFEGTFSNRRVFGQVASMVIPLLAFPLLTREMPRVQRWSVFALLAVWWMLVIVSGTRGTWMALAVAAVMLAAVAWRASLGWLRIQVAALGMGAVLFGVLFLWLPLWLGLDTSIENRLSDLATLSGRGRGVLWSGAWEQIQAHPWLGIGPMHLATIRNNFGAHPHNAMLQLAAEWGIPAALAFMLPVIFGLSRLLAKLQARAASTPLLVCLTASLLAITVQSMVDGVIVIPYTQTWLVLVAGWGLGAYFRGIAVPDVPNFGAVRWGLSGLSMLALALILYGIFPEVLNRAEVTRAYVDAGNSLIPPRYWGLGWIP